MMLQENQKDEQSLTQKTHEKDSSISQGTSMTAKLNSSNKKTNITIASSRNVTKPLAAAVAPTTVSRKGKTPSVQYYYRPKTTST